MAAPMRQPGAVGRRSVAKTKGATARNAKRAASGTPPGEEVEGVRQLGLPSARRGARTTAAARAPPTPAAGRRRSPARAVPPLHSASMAAISKRERRHCGEDVGDQLRGREGEEADTRNRPEQQESVSRDARRSLHDAGSAPRNTWTRKSVHGINPPRSTGRKNQGGS